MQTRVMVLLRRMMAGKTCLYTIQKFRAVVAMHHWMMGKS